MTSSTFSLNQKREKRGYSPPIGSCFLIRYVNRFFRECRNTQTIVITVTNQNKDNVTKSPRELKAKKLAKTWVTESLRFKFYIWLVEGEGWVSFPFKKITKISKAKRKQSYNIFDTHLKISLSNYSSSLFLKYYFCTGRVAQGYILKAEGAVIRVKRWCRTLSIKFVPTPFLTYALLVVSFPEIFLNCCLPKKSFKREIKPLKELASSHA